MSRVFWRWAEKDFGFRFTRGGGKAKTDFHATNEPGAFYTVPAKHRKLSEEHIKKLASATSPTSPRVVRNPWQQYDRDWDWIATEDGILLNYAGCLDREEIERREDEGVARAMELVASLVAREEPVALTTALVQQFHTELMGTIYPFAGQWRTVGLTKGPGPEKWPLPRSGIEPMIAVLDRDVFSRSPFVSAVDAEVFDFAAEVMGELLALHPFREGNGRTAFIIGNLVLMQNDMLPLDVYDRRADEPRYFAACEDARERKNYAPLAKLIAEWQQAAQARWEAVNGQ